jgi:hypothetical protein
MLISKRPWWHVVLLGGIVLLAVRPLLARAASPRVVPSDAWSARLGAALPATGPHFLYLDDGYPRNNRLSGYRITTAGLVPTPGSPYPTGGDEAGGVVVGLNQIATSAANGPCLFHTEDQPNQSMGQAESFQINPTTGALTEVSIVPLPGRHVQAGDVQVAADGRDIYVALYPVLVGAFYLDALTVGAGCRLSLASSMIPAGSDFSIALVGKDGLLAVDTYGNTLDLYRISQGTQLKLLSSTPSQIVQPLNAAVGQVNGQSYTFNGGG